jgi:hypothetical protein
MSGAVHAKLRIFMRKRAISAVISMQRSPALAASVPRDLKRIELSQNAETGYRIEGQQLIHARIALLARSTPSRAG